MRKHLHKRTKRHYKKHKRHSKKMYGGNFSDMDKNELIDLGFNNQDIILLETYIPNLNLIRISLQQINPETGNPFTPEELMQSLDDNVNDDMNQDNLNLSGISNNSDDSHELDNLDMSFTDNEDSMNTTSDNSNIFNENNPNNNYSFPSDNNSLHLSDLNDNNESSYNTTREEDSFGGKKRKSLKKYQGKKKYKGIKKNKSIKKHKRTQKGGTCYGRGVGANNYDPNFSIYNTRELQLFPYRPEK